jgi:hypothetical protein
VRDAASRFLDFKSSASAIPPPGRWHYKFNQRARFLQHARSNTQAIQVPQSPFPIRAPQNSTRRANCMMRGCVNRLV